MRSRVATTPGCGSASSGPSSGNYWVIGLDPDYRWAVVGEPDRRWLWVLSRTPKLEAAEFERALGIARAQGYDLGPLKVARGQKK